MANKDPYEVDIRVVSVEAIHENEWNPNAMEMESFNLLVEQVEAEGMHQPVLVTEKDGKPGEYQIVDGAHRLRAVRMAGLPQIAAVVVPYDEDHAKFRTISMNKIRGEYIPLRMAKLLADLEDRYDPSTIRRMTGIREEEFKSLAQLLEVPDIDLDDSPSVSMDSVDRPVEVNILLIPEEYESYHEAMVFAMEFGAPKVIPLIGMEVAEYDKAMKASFDLTSTKLRNVGLATICKVFNALPKEQKAALVGDVSSPKSGE